MRSLIKLLCSDYDWYINKIYDNGYVNLFRYIEISDYHKEFWPKEYIGLTKKNIIENSLCCVTDLGLQTLSDS